MKLEIISGLNGKSPAAILLTLANQRILLDAGGALELDEAPWPVPPDIDAILLSHDHVDHIADVHRLPPHIPIYCSVVTAKALPSGRNIKPIAIRGQFQLGNITVTTGSSGHAWGGVWFHFDLAGGIFYSGDISLESTLFHFDVPPPAKLALLDASYGLYDTPQGEQLKKLRAYFNQALLCPVPPSGRAVELALLMARDKGLSIALDSVCSAMLVQMAQHNDGSLHPGICAELNLLSHKLTGISPQTSVVLAAEADGVSGIVGALRASKDFPHRTLFTGHLNQLAYQQWLAGEVDFCRWNVHPTLSCLQKLTSQLSCRYAIPLFTCLEQPTLWQQALNCQIITDSVIEIK